MEKYVFITTIWPGSYLSAQDKGYLIKYFLNESVSLQLQSPYSFYYIMLLLNLLKVEPTSKFLHQ